ncbi:hypothetical protein LEP1GSC061_3219 [Leptospira wolffii serovar Khorat str. Khorat-H2]|nr:hypothetical protein LEP1GSC061_3219 [Leptospira wolffii serovar Khorat str. Khorat-H2]
MIVLGPHGGNRRFQGIKIIRKSTGTPQSKIDFLRKISFFGVFLFLFFPLKNPGLWKPEWNESPYPTGPNGKQICP